MDNDNEQLITTLLEATIYESPTDPGLSFDELISICQTFDKGKGELTDSLNSLERSEKVEWKGIRRGLTVEGAFQLDGFALFPFEPDPRNPKAFDLVVRELKEIGRHEGRARARADEGALIAKASAQGIDRKDVEVAIVLLLLTGHLIRESETVLRLPETRYDYPTASEQLAQSRPGKRERALLRKVMPLVRDAIGRRSDGRPASPDPVLAFAAELPILGFPHFGLWWEQTVAEWRQASGATTPTTVAVFSAALAEAALAFVSSRAQSVGAMTHKFNGPPTAWRFNQLLKSAKTGPTPILDDALVARGLKLDALRQRIHAGHWVDPIVSGPMPDINAEVAEESRRTLKVLLRAILDWLQQHPI